MRVAVVGVGGLGGYFGGRLARSGVDVTFIARGPHLAALVERGLVVHSIHGDFALSVRATNDPASVGPVDLVLFLVKTYDTVRAAEHARPLVGEGTLILSLQNGVDNAERIRAAVGRGQPLGGVAYLEAALEAPGVVGQYSQLQRIIVGELAGGTSARVARVVAMFSDAGVRAEQSVDITRELWTKWTFICALSGLTTVCRQPVGPVLANAETRELFLSVIREVVATGRAKRVALAPDAVDAALRNAEALAPTLKTSMQRDAELGRPLEIEALNGRVVEFGRELAVPTPVNAFVHAVLLPQHRAATAARTGPPD